MSRLGSCPDPNCSGRCPDQFRPMKKDGERLPSYGRVCKTMHRNIALPSDCGYYQEEFVVAGLSLEYYGEWQVSEGKTWTTGGEE